MTASAADQSHSEKRKMTVSERGIPALTAALQDWLAGRSPGPGRPTVSGVRMPDTGGLSSTSVLFEAELAGSAEPRGRYVARMAPEPTAVQVFPSYDLPGQFEVISSVAARCDIPLPKLRWNEPDGGALGTPFFVMDQVEGRIPLDNPPYVFTGWLLEATADERALLERASVRILAELHAIPDPAAAFPALRPPDGTGALRYHVDRQGEYYRWALAGDGIRVPIIERSLTWLEDHWPRDPGPDVFTWGDARIGNIIYHGFEPAAVLDWEMAALGPRELDVGWFIFLHRFFQDIAEFFEADGLPEFLRRSTVEQCYQELSGWSLRDMDFYLVYAALRHAIVMARIKRRMIHFGEDQVPDDPDDYVMHRASLEKLLAGTYRWD
jgi:aminoglycoside phosphotransferase (APT) family kinase protein